MTRTITITKSTPKAIQVFELMRRKKEQQVEKMKKMKNGTFSITL